MASGALSIKLRCTSWQQLATIYRRDLSRGTMFLRASAPPPLGTQVRIDLALPSASVVALSGVVHRHIDDPQRGTGVELQLSPIPAGSIWLIESALASEQRKQTPAHGVPVSPLPATRSGPIASLGDGEDLAAAESELIRALLAEAESLKKLNPFLVLGIGYEASDADVRKAFGELTKRYHPDRFARYESTELRAVAAEIFILIRDAYRRLGDEAGRIAVLTSLGRSAAPRAVPAPRAHPPAGAVSLSIAAPRPPVNRPATAQIPVLRPPGAADRSAPVRPIAEPPGAAVRTTPRAPTADPTAAPSPAAARGHAGAEGDAAALEDLIDAGRLDEALAGFKLLSKKHPQDRPLRAGIELCEGLLALQLRDRLEAAQRFETALEIDPSNERAARELADMRRQATNERKGLLSRLMGKRDD
ncbi:MAG: DnaJ domain-containing protein [Kofleriaceae bacterium]